MILLLAFLFLFILAHLFFESRRAEKDRAAIKHVVHVNGIRGKSTVTRLIDAGLRAGGFKVFCKTTGTDPIMIKTNGESAGVVRRGRANIKEQLAILHSAAAEGADVLVIECMAVDPALQRVAQHKMLTADIGVITNVRLDHTAEMGATLEQICDSLSNTIPQNGTLFTADAAFYPRLCRNAGRQNCDAVLATPSGDEPPFDFPENIALALAVCERLGVPRQIALDGMARYQRDPYALSIHTLPGGGTFANGLSINDPQSTEMVFNRLKSRYNWQNKHIILLINNRPDRGYRTRHMISVAQHLCPDEVWIMGASQLLVEKTIKRTVAGAAVSRIKNADRLELEKLSPDDVVFAIGNIAGEGRALMSKVREGSSDV